MPSTRGRVTLSRSMRRPLTLAALALVAGLAAPVGASASVLGPNVKVFDPSMSTSEIRATADAIAQQQVPNQFGPQRYALLFKPGTYGSASDPLNFQVGYGTEVAGLGASPGDVTINGTVEVFNQCDQSGCTALNNFWRSLSNLTIHVTGQTGCRSGTEFWAVSQASPMRRVAVTGGNLSLMDYCSAGPQYGDDGAPPQSFPEPPYTTLPATPQSRERPYLFV